MERMRTISNEVSSLRLRGVAALPSRRGPRTAPPALLWWGWAAALFLLYAAVGARRQALIRTTGYDLGIFEQAVKAYAQLRAPVAPLRGDGFNLLGDHFHPVLVVLAPLYRIAPSPYTLLFAQAALLALAVVPLARRARQALAAAPPM